MYGYVLHLYSPRNDYGNSPDFRPSDQLSQGGFASLYAVDENTAAAITDEGTAKAFKGVVWAERLWLDIDGYEKADAVEARLRGLGLSYQAYDTGGRGAHFGILRSHAPSHLLPQKDKLWVKAHFPEADTSIYTHLHPFRLVDTVHAKTGRVKALVYAQNGNALTLPPLKDELALSGTVGRAPSVGGGRSVFDCFRVMVNSAPAPQGQRHEQLVRLAYALRDDAQVDAATAAWWLLEANKRYSEPKEEHEVEKIVGGIYR